MKTLKDEESSKKEKEDSDTEVLVNKLNKMTEEYFEKVHEIMNRNGEGDLKACQFYLTMLLNQTVGMMQNL